MQKVDQQRVREGLAEFLAIPLENLHPETDLNMTGNWDSLAKMAAIALIVEATRASVSKDALSDAKTLGDIFDLLDTGRAPR
jgi:acyl carrier protein